VKRPPRGAQAPTFRSSESFFAVLNGRIGAMSEKRYLIPSPRVPWWKSVSTDRVLGVAALVVALGAVVFSGSQYRAASRQADIADQARTDAKKMSDDQAKDVERARTAAEKSAAAAEKLAAGMERSAKAAESSAKAGLDALTLNRRALILSNEPNVVAFNVRLSQPLTVGAVPEVNAQIGNLGKGTALKLQNRGWFFAGPKRVFLYPSADPPPSVSDLPPGGGILTLTLKCPVILTADTIKQIDDGALLLYVLGVSEYYDNTLAKSRKSTLYWCFYYDPNRTDKLQLVLCPDHNYKTVEP